VLVPQLVPRHSRPIDVHRWSDHPEVNALVLSLWEQHFQKETEGQKRGPKPKTRHRDQFKVLLLDLYVAWQQDPELSIGVHLNNSEWKTNSRYNALHLSKVIVVYIHTLEGLGYIEVAKGSYAGPGAPSNRNARIRAAEPLRELFLEAKFGVNDIGQTPDRESVILRGGNADAGKAIEYEDTEETRRWRRDLRQYNDLLYSTFIDIPSLDDPFVERTIRIGPRTGETQKIPIGRTNQFVRRVFSRGRWDLNGRFYGGWWQQIDSDLRKRIHINDVPTIEVDFRSLHINILSLEKGVPLDDTDPYSLNVLLFEGVDKREQRAWLKHLVLTAINAKTRKTAYSAFRDNFENGSRPKKLKNQDLDDLLEAFLTKYRHLEGGLFADQGIRLMNVDGRIAERVLRVFTYQNIPILCVHDSFIVDYNFGNALKTAMRTAARTVVGSEIHLSNNYLGLDEVPEERKDDYRDVRFLNRSGGYLGRKKLFMQTAI
jgi:hypothetical protein